jgi:hypothetical protein
MNYWWDTRAYQQNNKISPFSATVCVPEALVMDLAQLSPYLTSHILRFGAYATDELHIPPDVFDPALDEVDFGGEQPAAA